MDEPPAKRRKTVSPVGTDRSLSPLKQPPRRPSIASQSNLRADRQSSPLKEPPRRRPSISSFNGAPGGSSPLKQPPRRRPSFASPTKASLARNYPNLLSERRSASDIEGVNANGRDVLLARGKEARTYVMGDKGGHTVSAPENMFNGGDQASAGALQQSASLLQNVTPRARKTTTQARPSAMEDVLEEEPDLPATPSQREAEDFDTPRRGVLYSSPSKRPPRLKNPENPSLSKQKAPAVQQAQPDLPLDEPVLSREDKVVDQQEQQELHIILERRKRERNQLLQELKDLEHQILQSVDEIAKIQDPTSPEVLQPEEQEDFLTFINKFTQSDMEAEDERLPTISGSLCSFLPFSTHPIPQPKSRQARQEPVPSHRPLDLDDPLPYLEMFTDFTISTQLHLPRGRLILDSSRVQQKHVVDITGPQKLLSVSLSVIIDTLKNSIVDVQLLKLPPWADRELGMFVRSRAELGDLGNACWAIGSYWKIAKRRAEFWHRCETSFGRLLPGKAEEGRENRANENPEGSISRKNLNRHLGRDVLTLEDRNVMLRIKWLISFDWTGEAQSDVRVEHAVPVVWTEADTHGHLKKIPETFSSLVQHKGVFAAAKTIVALLFNEP